MSATSRSDRIVDEQIAVPELNNGHANVDCDVEKTNGLLKHPHLGPCVSHVTNG
jgi:hypothetical protein